MTPEFTVDDMTTSPPTPLVCNMTTAPDTPQERMAEYGRLFEHALVGRERTTRALTWRFVARPGVEAWVRDLSAREAACCSFLTSSVTAAGDAVTWHIAGDDEPAAQAVLDEFHQLPEHLGDGLTGLLERLRLTGLDVRSNDDGGRFDPPSSVKPRSTPPHQQVHRGRLLRTEPTSCPGTHRGCSWSRG
jgi:hypothetical protein